MNLIRAKDYAQLSRIAAGLIAAQVNRKPNSLLGFATGSSPVGTYQQLIAMCSAGDVDFSRVSTVNLDEYVGLPADHPQSYARFMRENLFDHINIVLANTNIPNGMNLNPESECRRYDDVIRGFGGVDLQLLGIGHDGHIGFNEPSDHFSSGTNCVTLTEMTIEANKRFFDSADDVPRQALTMGIYDIMMAKSIVMVVNGEDKAEILKAALQGPVTPQNPASILQYHPNCTVVADAAALSKL
ncbi:MAG: glucosamine-6-phosphate deaminase [Oscillospiraceae bacterium]|nr:glucosamine-6-phosphate deaminase [Oscillospiraceae bacterium]